MRPGSIRPFRIRMLMLLVAAFAVAFGLVRGFFISTDLSGSGSW